MIYQPAEDSYLLETQVKIFSSSKTVLDLGSGSGIQALAALHSNAKSVLATDIQSEVVTHLKNLGLNAVQSNLFSHLSDSFDLIIFNPPYLSQDKREPKESKIATSGGKQGDEIIIRFLKQAPKHLNPSGTILIAISSLTPKNRILSLLKSLKLKHTSLSSKKLFMEVLEVWKIKQ